MLDVEEHTCPHGEWAWRQCSKCDADKAERIRKLEKENAALRASQSDAATEYVVTDGDRAAFEGASDEHIKAVRERERQAIADAAGKHL